MRTKNPSSTCMCVSPLSSALVGLGFLSLEIVQASTCITKFPAPFGRKLPGTPAAGSAREAASSWAVTGGRCREAGAAGDDEDDALPTGGVAFASSA